MSARATRRPSATFRPARVAGWHAHWRQFFSLKFATITTLKVRRCAGNHSPTCRCPQKSRHHQAPPETRNAHPQPLEAPTWRVCNDNYAFPFWSNYGTEKCEGFGSAAPATMGFQCRFTRRISSPTLASQGRLDRQRNGSRGAMARGQQNQACLGTDQRIPTNCSLKQGQKGQRRNVWVFLL